LPNGRLASGSDDKTINIWNTKSGFLTRTLTGHTRSVEALVVLPDGRLVSGSDDKLINIWNAETGELLDTLEGHTRSVLIINFFLLFI